MLLTTKRYLARFAKQLGQAQLRWFQLRSALPAASTAGYLETGVILFPNSTCPPGGGFAGNAALYHIVDFRQVRQVRGRRLAHDSTPQHVRYEDWSGMLKLAPYPIKPIRKLVREELAHNCRSIYTYPARFRVSTAKARSMKVDGHCCQRTQYTTGELTGIRNQLTPQEWRVVYSRLYQLHWALTTACQELPIRIRIHGRDDGALEGIFPTLLTARRALHAATVTCSRSSFEHCGFFSTD